MGRRNYANAVRHTWNTIIGLSLLGASVLSLSGLSAREIARLPVRLVDWALHTARETVDAALQ